MLHFAFRGALRRLFGCTGDIVPDRLFGNHIHHHKADCALVRVDAREAGEQVTAALAIENAFTVAGLVFVFIGEVENTVHILPFVVDLVEQILFGLDTVDPLGHFIQLILLHGAAFGVHQNDAGGLGQAEQPFILVGGHDPIGPAFLVDLERMAGISGEQAGAKTHMPVQVVEEIQVGLVFDPVAVHVFHVLVARGGNQNIARGALGIGGPLQKTRMVQRHGPFELPANHLDGRFSGDHLAAQRVLLAEFFVCQVFGKCFVHNRHLADVHLLNILAELTHLGIGQLIPVSCDVEQYGRKQCKHDQDAPQNGKND